VPGPNSLSSLTAESLEGGDYYDSKQPTQYAMFTCGTSAAITAHFTASRSGQTNSKYTNEKNQMVEVSQWKMNSLYKILRQNSDEYHLYAYILKRLKPLFRQPSSRLC